MIGAGRKLGAEDQAMFDEACSRGYLLRRSERKTVSLAWWSYCRENGQPFVVQTNAKKSARIEVDMHAAIDPEIFHYENHTTITDEGLEKARSLFHGLANDLPESRRAAVKRASMFSSQSGIYVLKFPIEDADELAKGLYEIGTTSR